VTSRNVPAAGDTAAPGAWSWRDRRQSTWPVVGLALRMSGNLSWNHRLVSDFHRFPIPIARLSDATSEFSFFDLGALTRAPHFASGILTAVELPFRSLRVDFGPFSINRSGTVPATIGDTTNGSLIGLFLLPLSQCLGRDMLVTQKLWSASETAKADSEGQWFLMIDALSSCMALTEHDLPLKYFAIPTS